MGRCALALLGAWLWFGHAEVAAQEQSVQVSVQRLMTAEDFRAAGLHKLTPAELEAVDAWFALTALRIVAASRSPADLGGDLTEEQLEEFFREHTISGKPAVAIKLRFSVPRPGTAYLGTIHGYPNNQQVCEELIAPYNADPSLTTIPGGRYFCEVLR